MLLIDYKDSRPIYEQIVERYKILILQGILPAGEKLPSVRSLAMELSINPNTIQRAYGELERQGYIYTVQGKGNFVADSRALKEQYMDEILCRMKEQWDIAVASGISEEELLKKIEGWKKHD